MHTIKSILYNHLYLSRKVFTQKVRQLYTNLLLRAKTYKGKEEHQHTQYILHDAHIKERVHSGSLDTSSM